MHGQELKRREYFTESRDPIQRVSNIEEPERIVAVTLGQAGRLEKLLMYGRHSKHTIKRSYCW